MDDKKTNLLIEHSAYRDARKAYGLDFELSMLQEECAELIVAISKYRRNITEYPLGQIIEEVADVENLLQQLRFWFPHIDADIAEVRVSKLDRLKARIEASQADVMARVDGKSFRCEDCGCNVFRHPPGEPLVFVCNSCGARYRGEVE